MKRTRASKKPDPKFAVGQRVRYEIFLCEIEELNFDSGEWLYTLSKFELDPAAPPQPVEDVGYMSSHDQRLRHIKDDRGDSDYAYEDELEAISDR